ncbi:hypothetical protein D1007_19187 [Hordeum vulgare]|nr:hypothetical protein D1007_19187 [Hordeum vulgare]
MKNMSLDLVQENDESEQNHENSDEMQSEEDSEEVDDMLLIDTMAAEAKKSHMRESEKGPTEGTSYDKIVVNSLQITPSLVNNRKFSSYLDACVGEPTITEMEHDDNSCQKKDQPYFVQSPVESSEPMDVIPTPPALEEVQARFSKRTTGVNMEHVGARAEKMAKKRNLQGLEVVNVTKKIKNKMFSFFVIVKPSKLLRQNFVFDLFVIVVSKVQ